MKTKIFEFHTGGCFVILGFARTVGERCYVSFVYNNCVNEVRFIEMSELDLSKINKWALKNNCIEVVTAVSSEFIFLIP